MIATESQRIKKLLAVKYGVRVDEVKKYFTIGANGIAFTLASELSYKNMEVVREKKNGGSTV